MAVPIKEVNEAVTLEQSKILAKSASREPSKCRDDSIGSVSCDLSAGVCAANYSSPLEGLQA